MLVIRTKREQKIAMIFKLVRCINTIKKTTADLWLTLFSAEHSGVQDLYIQAARMSPQDIDADVQVYYNQIVGNK